MNWDRIEGMKTKMMALAMAAALGSYCSLGYAALTKEERKAEENRISAELKSGKEKCSVFSGNARDICLAEVNGAGKVARAELEARDKGTIKAQAAVRDARADADYAVAVERCDDKAGNVKDVCRKEAKAAMTRAKADAKVERESREANQDANARVADAQQAASRDTNKAEYKAARERCDAYSGDAKDRCISDAKARFGK